MIVIVECIKKLNTRVKKSQKAIKKVRKINIVQNLLSINYGRILKS